MALTNTILVFYQVFINSLLINFPKEGLFFTPSPHNLGPPCVIYPGSSGDNCYNGYEEEEKTFFTFSFFVCSFGIGRRHKEIDLPHYHYHTGMLTGSTSKGEGMKCFPKKFRVEGQ